MTSVDSCSGSPGNTVAPPGSRLNRAASPLSEGPTAHNVGGAVSEPKSDAGKRTLSLPVPVTDELRAHRKAQLAVRVASEIWEQGPDGGWVFANGRGGPTYPRADGRDFKALCGQAKVPAQAAP